MTIAQSLATQLESYTGDRKLKLYKALDNIAKLDLEDSYTQKLIGIACLTHNSDFRFVHANTPKSLAYVLNKVLEGNQRERIPSLPEDTVTDPSRSTGVALGIAHTKVHQNFPTEFAEKFMGKDELATYKTSLIQDIEHPNFIKQGVMFGSIALAGKQHKQTLGEYVFEVYQENRNRFDTQQFMAMISLMAQAPGNVRVSDIKISQALNDVDKLARGLYVMNALYASQKRLLVCNKAHNSLAMVTLEKIEEIMGRNVNSDEKRTSLQHVLVQECMTLRDRGSRELLNDILYVAEKTCRAVEIDSENKTYRQQLELLKNNVSADLEDDRVALFSASNTRNVQHPIDMWDAYLTFQKESQFRPRSSSISC